MMKTLATVRGVLLRSSGKQGVRCSALIVCAAYSDKPSRLGHLLPKKGGGQRKSAVNHQPAPCHEDCPAPVSQEQVILAAQLLAQNEELYDGTTELSIISSLDLDDVLHEAERLQWEVSPPDLDTLRQFGPLLVRGFDEQRVDDADDASAQNA